MNIRLLTRNVLKLLSISNNHTFLIDKAGRFMVLEEDTHLNKIEISLLHKCDNKICINLDHLYLGTNDDNMRDKAIRERCVQIKISNKEVIRIRELAGKIPRKYLALYYGVRVNTICRIINRKRRRHI